MNTGATVGRRLTALPNAVAALVILAVSLAVAAVPASAAYRHSAAPASFGSDGTSGTSLGGPGPLAFNQAGDRLYAVGSEPPRLYGFDTSTPGTYAPLGGSFPLTLPAAGAGYAGLGVDSSSGNIFHYDYTPGLYGYDSAGAVLSGFPIPRTEIGNEACAVAVDPDGHVWVGDSSSQKIFEYSQAGLKLRTVPISGSPCALAFDSNGDLYVSYVNSNGATWKYTAASDYSSDSATQIDPGGGRFLAIDRTTHTLYVVHFEDVTAYNSEGTQLEVFATSLGQLGHATIDESTGALFVSAPGAGNLRVFPGVVVPNLLTGPPGAVGDTVTGSIDPIDGGEVTNCKFEYGLDTTYGSSAPCSPAPNYSTPVDVSGTLVGLAAEIPYHYRIVASNANGSNFGADRTIIPHFVGNLTTTPATNLAKHGATLNATYNGNGQDTSYYFEWGSTTSYGNVTPLEDASDGAGPQSVNVDLAGLQSDSSYHYRVVASNDDGTSVGLDQEFSTLNAVIGLTTEDVTDLTGTSATLNGSWTGDGTSTNYYFEWGFTSAYGNASAAPPGTDGSGLGAQSRSFGLTELAANATYHYRIVASNPAGTSVGKDRTFKTLILPTTSSHFTTDLTPTSAKVNGTVNPKGGGPTTFHIEYGTDQTYGSSTPESASVGSDGSDHTVNANLSGLSPGTVYHFHIVATSAAGVTHGLDQTFTTVPNFPTVVSSSSSGVTAASANLHAQIRPGYGATVAYFEYGPSSSYGATTIPGDPLAGDDSEHLVSATVTGLDPGTTYHYRAVALNFGGATSGTDHIFTTPDRPSVDGLPVISSTATSAVVSARINPRLSATTYHFEYGTGDGYGMSTAGNQFVGSDNVSHTVTATMTELSPGTTYHYRAVATNAVGVAAALDGTFTTEPAPAGSRERSPIKCKKGFIKRGGKCVKKPRRRHKARQHRHASRSHG